MPTLSTSDQTNLSISSAGAQHSPDAIALAGGGFAVAYLNAVAPSFYQVLVQRFDASGASVGAPVGLGFGAQAPQVARLADGGFVVAWTAGSGANTADVFAQRFSSDAVATGAPFMLNSAEAGDQRLLELTELAGGGFVAFWSQPQQLAPTTSPGHNPFGQPATFVLTAQVYDATGAKVGAAQGLTPPAATIGDFEARPLSNGGFILVKDAYVLDHSELVGQAYDASGRPVGPALQLAAGADPQVTVLADDSFVVAYRTTDGHAAVQHFALDGEALGEETLLPSHTRSQAAPDVEALPDGGYLVSYYADVAKTGAADFQLFTQRFNDKDHAVGPTTQLSTAGLSTFLPADLAIGADGAALAVWTARPVVSENDVAGRLIDPPPGANAHASDFIDLGPLAKLAEAITPEAVADQFHDFLSGLKDFATEALQHNPHLASFDLSAIAPAVDDFVAHYNGGDWLF